jgi:transposase-like protein
MIAMYCPRCGSELQIPAFTPTEKKEITDFIHKNRPMAAIQVVVKNYGLSLRASKAIISHLNKKKGHCHRCSQPDLNGENVICTQCKCVNLNW